MGQYIFLTENYLKNIIPNYKIFKEDSDGLEFSGIKKNYATNPILRKIQLIIEFYIKSKKKIDEAFFKKVINILKNSVNTYEVFDKDNKKILKQSFIIRLLSTKFIKIIIALISFTVNLLPINNHELNRYINSLHEKISNDHFGNISDMLKSNSFRDVLIGFFVTILASILMFSIIKKITKKIISLIVKLIKFFINLIKEPIKQFIEKLKKIFNKTK